MQTLYSSICIFHSDLFSEGLTETPEGSMSLSARSPPFLFRVMVCKNNNKTGVSSLRATLGITTAHHAKRGKKQEREELARFILSGLVKEGGCVRAA